VSLGHDSAISSTGSHNVSLDYFYGGGIALWNIKTSINEKGIVTDLYTWGSSRDRKITQKTYQLSDSEKEELDTLILDANILELDSEYTCKGTAERPCPTDMLWHSLTFTIDGVGKKISGNRNFPDKIQLIIKKINDIRKLLIEIPNQGDAPESKPFR